MSILYPNAIASKDRPSTVFEIVFFQTLARNPIQLNQLFTFHSMINSVCWQLKSLQETQQAGRKISQIIAPISVILLYGDMGSGKTTLIKSICAGLGVSPDSVISPTYTIVNMYSGKNSPIYHLDLYRLPNEEALADFDRDDLICSEGVTLIEWPKYIHSLLGKECLFTIQLQRTSEEWRILTLSTEKGRLYPLPNSFQSKDTHA